MLTIDDLAAEIISELRHDADCPGTDVVRFTAKRTGEDMLACQGCSRSYPVAKLAGRVGINPTTGASARFSLLCIDCEQETAPTSARPRLPLCRRCRHHRTRRARRTQTPAHPRD